MKNESKRKKNKNKTRARARERGMVRSRVVNPSQNV